MRSPQRERASGPALVASGTMPNLAFSALVAFVVVLSSGCGGEAGGTLTAGEVAKDAAKYDGKKVKLSGIYAQGFSYGGRPADPWALVIKDKPADKESVSCVIPAKVEIKGNYPKITAEGTLEVEKTGAKRIKLNNCTYKLDG